MGCIKKLEHLFWGKMYKNFIMIAFDMTGESLCAEFSPQIVLTAGSFNFIRMALISMTSVLIKRRNWNIDKRTGREPRADVLLQDTECKDSQETTKKHERHGTDSFPVIRRNQPTHHTLISDFQSREL